jgi:hypothetical protein
MAGVMAFTFLLALRRYPRGRVEMAPEELFADAPAGARLGAGVADAG